MSATYGQKYSEDPYYAHQPPVDEYHYPPVPASNDFNTADFVGRDTAAQRDLVFRGMADGGDYGSYEKSTNPVSRGSIAAQMAAEGQIPKKEGLRMWRTDEHAGALMRGGRGKCCLRVCGCCFVLVLVILVGIVSAFLLWVRPPNVTFNGVEAPSNGSEVEVQTNGFIINFDLNVLGVINPNFFGANFKSIKAKAFYSTAPNVEIGGGELDDFSIPKNSNTTIHFPFTVNYTTTIDPNLAIVTDMAQKCGFVSSAAGVEKLDFNYNIRLGLKVLGVVITPSFSSSTSIDCPLTESDVEGVLGSSVLSGISSLRVKRDDAELHDEARRAVLKVLERSVESWQMERRRWDPVRLFV